MRIHAEAPGNFPGAMPQLSVMIWVAKGAGNGGGQPVNGWRTCWGQFAG
jgi:hypothetical protein